MERLKKVHSGPGKSGIPTSYYVGEYTGHDDLIRALCERGCGAWVGRAGCNAEPTYIVTGGINLAFSLYRNAMVSFTDVIGVVCEKHFPDPKIEMAPALRKSQRRELEKLLEREGIEENPFFAFFLIDEAV